MAIQSVITVKCVGVMAQHLHVLLTGLKQKHAQTFFDYLQEPVIHMSSPTPLSKMMRLSPTAESSSVRFIIEGLPASFIPELTSILTEECVRSIDVSIISGQQEKTTSIDPQQFLVEELLKEISTKEKGDL